MNTPSLEHLSLAKLLGSVTSWYELIDCTDALERTPLPFQISVFGHAIGQAETAQTKDFLRIQMARAILKANPTEWTQAGVLGECSARFAMAGGRKGTEVVDFIATETYTCTPEQKVRAFDRARSVPVAGSLAYAALQTRYYRLAMETTPPDSKDPLENFAHKFGHWTVISGQQERLSDSTIIARVVDFPAFTTGTERLEILHGAIYAQDHNPAILEQLKVFFYSLTLAQNPADRDAQEKLHHAQAAVRKILNPVDRPFTNAGAFLNALAAHMPSGTPTTPQPATV